MKILNGLVVASVMFLFACEGPINPSVTPTPTPTSTSTPEPVKSFGKLSISVKDGTSSSPIGNAEVKVSSFNNFSKILKTSSDGNAVFDGLESGINYEIEIKANDYVTRTISTTSSNLEIKKDSTSNLNVNLFKSIGEVKGKVIEENGNPVENAVVSAGNLSTLTDASGSFTLNIGDLSKQTIKVNKIRFNEAVYGEVDLTKELNINIGDIKLTSNSNLPSILFDTSKASLGFETTNSINSLINLDSLLQNSDFVTNFDSIETLTSLDNFDVLVLASPSKSYLDSEIQKITNFVKSGKKLVILGEWGGFGKFDVNSINSIIKEANLKINTDIVKETSNTNHQTSDDYIISTNLSKHFLTNNVPSLIFYSSASVESFEGGIKSLDTSITKIISSTTPEGFRIQLFKNEQLGLVGVSMLGSGKVVVLGDTSIFTDDDTNANGKINLDEAGNKQFALNIFNW